MANRITLAKYPAYVAADTLEGSAALLNGMNQRVIMPAGNVFMFTDIDMDDIGYLYSPVTYAQGVEGAERN
jgi:hypothetical protein